MSRKKGCSGLFCLFVLGITCTSKSRYIASNRAKRSRSTGFVIVNYDLRTDAHICL